MLRIKLPGFGVPRIISNATVSQADHHRAARLQMFEAAGQVVDQYLESGGDLETMCEAKVIELGNPRVSSTMMLVTVKGMLK